MKTEKQLKSFRIELQKTQEQQEQRRIQQETAKVFLGTVIQRGETNTRSLLKTIRLRLNSKKDAIPKLWDHSYITTMAKTELLYPKNWGA